MGATSATKGTGGGGGGKGGGGGLGIDLSFSCTNCKAMINADAFYSICNGIYININRKGKNKNRPPHMPTLLRGVYENRPTENVSILPHFVLRKEIECDLQYVGRTLYRKCYHRKPW